MATCPLCTLEHEFIHRSPHTGEVNPKDCFAAVLALGGRAPVGSGIETRVQALEGLMSQKACLSTVDALAENAKASDIELAKAHEALAARVGSLEAKSKACESCDTATALPGDALEPSPIDTDGKPVAGMELDVPKES